MQDTKFAVALHILVMLSESERQLNSESLAESVGSNASYIRKIMALLKDKGYIVSHRGKSGTTLKIAPRDLNLWMIYKAVQTQENSLFAIHQHANQACPVGKNIEQAITPYFTEAEETLKASLSQTTLQDIIDELYRIGGKNESCRFD
ncbi:Rrf2 family transcriptional regulator [uncultured Ligilactobacillus sp.]|uniref:Rrf2 family transcriptional regulator n=1 Tax=uncultured Ligilactobacillus sp. TaxID=2837633 RepID=UPI00272D6583|nr:Rrf2 family transcriptional regulator [uncultured Ligilactobacillus sp.]